MTKQVISLWVALIVVAIIAVGGYSFPGSQTQILGASGTRFPNGISVGGGNINLAGCYQMYATSTATVGKLVASTTATIEGVDGVMMFQFGSCI